MEPHEIQMYQEMVRRHRGTPAQIGAGSVESQQARFIVIRDVLDSMLGETWYSMRLLDFGCGTGDLPLWLRANSAFDPVSRYLGVDAIKENVDDARAKGSFDFRNELWDGNGPIAGEDFDLIVFSGTMNTTRLERRTRMYRRLLEQARVGVVGNFLMHSHRVNKPFTKESVLMEPEQCLGLIDRDTFRTQLRTDYLPHCFTVGAIRWDWHGDLR